MEFIKKHLLVVVLILISTFCSYLTVNQYYSYLIVKSGYSFSGSNYSIIPAIMLIFYIIFFSFILHKIYKIKNYKLALIVPIPVLLSLAYFMHSPLSQEDHIYEIALDNYGKTFNRTSSSNIEKIHKHNEYLKYKYQLDHFKTDKSTRKEYVNFANEKVIKYNNYLKDEGIPSLKSLYSSRYYVVGKEFNDFLFRYKGIENPEMQAKLYEITKSGVVTYTDMMDFQIKFINDYKENSKGE